MSKPAEALTIEQIVDIMQWKSHEIIRIGRKQIYDTPIGRIYYRGSKNFKLSNKNWWYSINPEIVIDEQVDFLCLATDYIGILLIPSKKFLEYRKHNKIGKVKSGGEDFSVVKEGSSLIRRESKCQDWNITEFFISVNSRKSPTPLHKCGELIKSVVSKITNATKS